MSRVAKAPVKRPGNVDVVFQNGEITVKGPKGTLTRAIHNDVKVITSTSENVITFEPVDKNPAAWAQTGTARALVNNMVKGVSEGFSITLELVGVGYRAQAQGEKVNLSLGFSHPVEYQLPAGISAETPSNTVIHLKGIDKQLLGQVAAEIRAIRPPEPYKGKGVKYSTETIIRKEAKKK